jgi:predicted acetyltransferase
MSPHVRRVDVATELDPFLDQAFRGFGLDRVPEADAVRRPVWDDAVLHAAVDGEHGIVGTIAGYRFELTVPGGASVPMLGTAGVTVAGTHRRRGLLRSMMDVHLDTAVAEGFPLAGLWASEATIYGRFGFGPASRQVLVRAERCRLRDGVGADVSLRRASAADAATHVRTVYETVRAEVPGTLSRSSVWWEARELADPVGLRDGASERQWVLAPDGYVAFRTRPEWSGATPCGVVEVDELLATTSASRAALWRFVSSVDLHPVVEVSSVALDDPLWWMVEDPRALRFGPVVDALWLRVLDVPAVLSARRWGAEDRFVLDVVDPTRPSGRAAGRWVLDGGPQGATVRRARRGARVDVALDVADLGAVVLGGSSPSTLGRAGRIVECTAGSLARLSRFVAADPPPLCSTHF